LLLAPLDDEPDTDDEDNGRRTVPKVDSMGLVVRRWTQCSAGKS